MNATRIGLALLALLALLAVVTAACGARGVPETAEPGVASAAVERTAPDRPLRTVFDWTLLDGEARFTGSGAGRIEPPYRARLDLFGPRGEGYLSAALVEDEIRLPPGTERVPLPPPALMWAVLGVVAPPVGAVLQGTRVEGERTELYYAAAGRRLKYTLEAGALRRAEWTGGDRRLTVELDPESELGVPDRAVYRDWSGHTELMLNREQVEEVEPYPPEIWTP